MQLRVFPAVVAAASIISAQTAGPGEFFELRIRPILATQCFSCHTASKLGGLRVDSRRDLLRGGKSGPAIVPGKPDESLLIRAVRHESADLKMPMGGRLKDSEIAELVEWVRTGAAWPEPQTVGKAPEVGFHLTPEQKSFWAFQPLGKPEPPKVRNSEWAASPIDRFVLAKLEEKNLEPVATADKRSLIRRATFDLIGLPPTVEDVDNFLSDSSSDAFAKVVDRLIGSPRYGERWGRHWLDVARYADGDARRGGGGYANTWRYRDWVIEAFNDDMPYDMFIKAQIAGDLIDPKDSKKLIPGLGLFGLGPWGAGQVDFREARATERDDRLDVVTRGFLGLTVACARCHNHKYDPISQNDYYALTGVFAGTEYKEYLLGPQEDVDRYKAHQEKVRAIDGEAQRFLQEQEKALREILARQTSRYLMAARKALILASKPETAKIAADEKLDTETLERWIQYLGEKRHEHKYLDEWNKLIASGGGSDEEARKLADSFQALVLSVMTEKNALEAENRIASRNYKPRPDAARVTLPGGRIEYEDFCEDCRLIFKPIERDKFHVWIDLFVASNGLSDFAPRENAVLQYKGDKVLRFLGPEWRRHVELIRADAQALRRASPPEYPYLMGITDFPKPVNLRLHIRGSFENLGDEVPRGLPGILAGADQPAPFRNGSGRLELAEAIVNHPLAARVMVNRLWAHHFGRGIVGTPSNFGTVGERPSNPELLEYLATRFRSNNWSIKAMHREIMLSATYQLSTDASPAAMAVDPDNRLHWRMNRRRLDAESIRDAILSLSGTLDLKAGGPGIDLGASSTRRTVYARISRGGPEGLLTLFDFPNPRLSSEQRVITNVPLQGLFFLNSEFILGQAEKLAKRLHSEVGADDSARIHRAYRLMFAREATEREVELGLAFLRENSGRETGTESAVGARPAENEMAAWKEYAQVLLSSNELFYIN